MGVGMGVGGGGGGSAMRKMFRLLPSYSTLWLAPSRSVRKVGSRGFSLIRGTGPFFWLGEAAAVLCGGRKVRLDRKSTRLNSSHANISYAVFCSKKKNVLLKIALLLAMPSRSHC